MAMHKVFIGIGSNIGNRLIHLQEAIDLIMKMDGTSVCAVSSIYMTEPIGETEQNRFYNGVILLETTRSPEELRLKCKTIEQELGRPEGYPRWSARVIDLDILLYDDLRIDTDALSIPHPELLHRKFVLIPLLDIANPLHPATGETVSELLDHSEDRSVLIKVKENIRISTP